MTFAFEKLEVWQRAIVLTQMVYKTTQTFPKEEQFGLTSQLRRAAVSIVANIAEGKGRYHQKEFVQFLCVAAGSASELSTQLVISSRIGICSHDELASLNTTVGRVSRMLQGLIRSIREKANDRKK